ncbi:MAG: beta-galactosidase trimerization domain-containing protein [Lentisphaeria bacterium]|nr:beta-galactosidase trimerization domain-containing protein [Lentisphaeria bacterium]
MVYYPRYALFYDFHTSPMLKNIGKDFDAEAFAARLKANNIDFVSFPARCNMGMAYYDTKIGIRHYGLDFDLFGTLVEACKKYGIKVNAYFNGGISQEETRLHPEWLEVPTDKRPIYSVNPFSRTACGNTPYREHITAMACEVAKKYDVAGFFIDCLAGRSCRCECCLKKMKAEGIDPSDEAAVNEFALRRNRELAKSIADAVKEINPDFLLYFNGIGYENQLALGGTYLDFECIPTKLGCDYDYLPLMSRYMRTLGNYPRLNMTGRFNLWGDFGGLRSETAIRQELVTGLVNGMRPNIGDHMPPECVVPEKVMQQSERLFAWLQERGEFYDDNEPLTDMAILFPKSHQEIYLAKELRGALRILCDLHCQFDVVTMAADWSKYKLLVLPDSVTLTAEVEERLHQYIAKGGKIISSGNSGMKANTQEFLAEWDLEVAANAPNPTYFVDKDGMKMSIYADGKLLASKNNKTIYQLAEPHIEHIFDGTYPEYYNPPAGVIDYPFLSVNDKVAHFSFNIFNGFKEYAAASLREAFAEALEIMHPNRLVKTKNLPKYVRVYLNQRPDKSEILHMTAHIPEKRTDGCEVIEDDLTILASKVYIKTDKNTAFSEPEHIQLAAKREGEYLVIDVPQFTGYSIITLK